MAKKFFSIIRATGPSQLDGKKQHILFHSWNLGLFILSTLGICLVSLTLALGMYNPKIFFGYFKVPLVFLLNYLPILILQLILLAIFNRQFLAFFFNSLIFLSASIGHFYTLKLRGQPFDATLVGDISAGLQIASNYDLSPNSRVLLAIACIIFGTAFMLFFVRGRLRLPLRGAIALVCLLSLFPLWKFVYSDQETYDSKTYNPDHVVLMMPSQVFASKGFVYPFIHSFAENAKVAPAGYDAEAAAQLISKYSDSDIPEDKKPHVMIFQMESFADLESIGVAGIDPSVYENFRKLQEDSISGTVLTNVFGGGTLKSEQCLLTGSWTFPTISKTFPSYVWYMQSQGYYTDGVHPHFGGMYNRKYTSPMLGFEEYIFFEDYFEAFLPDGYTSDHALFPYMLSRYADRKSNEQNMFSFVVSLQGHGPYESTQLLYDEVWKGDGSYGELYYCLNNYLGGVRDSMSHLSAFVDELRNDEKPVVLLIYGDHLPHVSANENIFQRLGINVDQNTKEGWYNHYATPYLIWANDAARELYGKDFVGSGEDTSICYLMNLLFNELEWEGPAFMQFTESIRQHINVAGANGQFIENGEFTTTLSQEGAALLSDYKHAEYYLANDMKFDGVEK